VKRFVCTHLAVLFALAASLSVARGESSLVVAAKLRKAPTIDGKITAAEWKGAAVLTGFKRTGDGQVSSRPQPRVRIATFGDSLYFAFESPFEESLSQKVTKTDGPVWKDDAFEIFLDPRRSKSKFYQIVVNAAGAHYDVFTRNVYPGRPKARRSDTKWSSKLTYKTRITGRVWSGEIAVPFSSFTSRKVIPGELWGFNVCRDFRKPVEYTSLYHTGTQFSVPWRFPVLALGADPVVLLNSPAGRKMISGEIEIKTAVQDPLGAPRLEVRVETASFSSRLCAALSGQAVLLDSGGKICAGPAQLTFGHGANAAMLDFAKRPAGTYRVKILVKDKVGATVSEKAIDVWKPYDAKPDWLGNKIGLDDTVPPPWTPLKVSGGVVECWNRAYDFGEAPFPRRIKIAGEPVLAGPIELVVSMGRESVPLRWKNVAVKRTGPDKAVIEGDASRGGFAFRVRTTVEFDGFMRSDITISPGGKNELSGFALTIPLRSEWARWRYSLDRQDPWVWDRSPRIGEVKASSNELFSPYIWLGCHKGGLLWCAEDDRDWRPVDSRGAVQIAKTSGGVELRLNVIGTPTRLDGPVQLSFGIQATPVKPMPKMWHAYYSGLLEPHRRSGPGIYTYIDMSGYKQPSGWYHFMWNAADPAYKPIESYKKKIRERHALGRKFLPYALLNVVDKDVPQLQYFRSDWCTGHVSDNRFVQVCPESSWADFILRRMKRFFELYDIDGMYFDYGSPLPCWNTRGSCGCGYKVNGKLRASYPIFGERELRKRFYKMVKEKRPGAVIVLHTQARNVIPCTGFSDVYLDGERFLGKVERNFGGNYIRMIPLVRFRIEFAGTHWGLIPLFLPELHRKAPPGRSGYGENPELTHKIMALCMLHGTNVHSGFNDWEVVNEILRRKAYAFGDDMPNVRFVPYWDNKGLFASDRENVKVSACIGTRKILLAVANFSRSSTDCTIKLDSKRLSLPQGPMDVVDLIRCEGFTLSKGVLKCRMRRERLRLIEIPRIRLGERGISSSPAAPVEAKD